jgi:tetratricopeptide (TPR) repeat protein
VIPIRVGDTLTLPELAKQQGLEEQTFTVDEVVKGGMGVCVRIRPTMLGASFALKMPVFAGAYDAEALDRFLTELRVWLNLSSCDGIVEALCVFRWRGRPVVVSRWMEGGSLRSRMAKKDPAVFYAALIRVAGALDWAAARQDVLHQDLKPENILFDEHGRAQVSDWGIAQILEEGTDGLKHAPPGPPVKVGSTEARLILGSIAYASPEQVLGGVPLDVRSDVYSLGTIMYEWETGRLPFEAPTWDELRKRKLFESPRRMSGIFRRSAFGADDLIKKCLASDREERFPDFKALGEALVNAALLKGVAAAPFVPKQRYASRTLDAASLKARMASGGFVTADGSDGRRAPVAWEGARRDLDEAAALEAAGDAAKAHLVYARHYMPSLVKELADDELQQAIVLGVARTHLKLNRPAETLRALDTLSGAAERPKDSFVLAAQACLALGDFAQAERLAFAGTARHGGDRDLLDVLVKAQTALDRGAEAAKTAMQRLKAGRETPALETAAALLMRAGTKVSERSRPERLRDLLDAAALLREAKERPDASPGTPMALVRTLVLLERWAEALAELGDPVNLSRSGEKGRERAELYVTCLVKTGGWERTLSLCDPWLKAWPKSSVLKRAGAQALILGLESGLALEGAKAAGESARRFFESITHSLDERRPEDFVFLARYHAWDGDRKGALDVLADAKHVFPASWEILHALATGYERQGSLDLALEAAEEAARVAPHRAELWRALANVNGALGRPRAAAEALQRAVAADREIAGVSNR